MFESAMHLITPDDSSNRTDKQLHQISKSESTTGYGNDFQIVGETCKILSYLCITSSSSCSGDTTLCDQVCQ